MARTKAQTRFVLTKDGRMRIRRAVAYVITRENAGMVKRFMLSVYAKAHAKVKTDEDVMWLLVARERPLRIINEEEQMALLETLTYRAALEANLDFVVEIEAIPKVPTKQEFLVKGI